MKISQALIYGFEPNFTYRHNIARPKLGEIFDLEVKGEGDRDSVRYENSHASRKKCHMGVVSWLAEVCAL